MLIKSYWCFPFPSSFPHILRRPFLTHPLWTRRQAGIYCVCFYRQFSQGKLGSFRKRGRIRKFLFCVTTAKCNVARFQSSPTQVCSHTAGLGWPIAHGGEKRKRAAYKGMWRTGLHLAAFGRAAMPSYLHASSCGPAFLSTTGIAASEQKLMESLQLLLCCLLLPSCPLLQTCVCGRVGEHHPTSTMGHSHINPCLFWPRSPT